MPELAYCKKKAPGAKNGASINTQITGHQHNK
uniref:Uncharacterized protein n=1 Tax=Caudovirales sp. ctLhN17 TaxID=2825764 RepID=A0A8S5NV99_9CAUD|nr:MAG TPA: hypothetical protein [Caudovirales sp. ctLhN17]